VLTGLHGLHLAGGLWVWVATLARMRQASAVTEPDAGETDVEGLRVRVELCTLYWHFLLLVWLVLFGLLLLT
jgi:cytochrome c oxidase subunit 3